MILELQHTLNSTCAKQRKKHMGGTRKWQNLFLHNNNEQEEEDNYGDAFTLHKWLDSWTLINPCDSWGLGRILWGKLQEIQSNH